MREFKPILGLDEISKSRLLNVQVLTQDGKETVITISAADQVKTIKEKILGEAAAKDLPSYKVILLSPRRVLEDQRTIEQEGILEDDHFVVCPKRRNVMSPFRKSTSYSSKGPDIAHIKKCTEYLGDEKGSAATNPGLGYAGMFDFFGELKRILVSLTEVASLVQHVSGEEAGSEVDAMDTDDSIDVQIDPLCLKKLTDMGFSESRGRKALIVNRMCPVQAMEWLLQHENDEDIDKALTPDEIATFLPEKVGRRGKRGVFKKREFTPNARALVSLKEMGFDEKDVLEALKVSANNQERALDWLLGSDRPAADQNPDGGLDPTSPLYTAIMDHPVVQLGMTNPRILHAFEDMLENPNNSGQYINDPEIGPVLLQISRIVQSFSR